MARKPKAKPSLFPEKQPPLLLATNRANVLSMMSSGIIAPASAYQKHYPDATSLGGSRLLAFRGSVPLPLLRQASDGDAFFDVLLEMDEKLVNLVRALALSAEGSPEQRPGGDAGEASQLLLEGPIPWAAVTRVHVRTNEHREDFLAREFEDVPPDLVDVSVSPDFWAERRVEAPASSSVEPPSTAGVDYRGLDRWAGALAVFRAVMPPGIGWDAVVAEACSASGKPRGIPKRLPVLPPSSDAPRHFLVSGRPEAAGSVPEGRVWTVALEHALRSDPGTGFVAPEIVAAILADPRLAAHEDARLDLGKWGKVCQEVLAGQRGAPPLDDGGMELLRAVLLFLLRPEPDRLVDTPSSSLRPGPNVLAAAAILSGAAQGYARLPRRFKASREAHCGLSLVVAARAWADAGGGPWPLAAEFRMTDVDVEPPGTRQVTVAVGDCTVAGRRIGPSDDMSKLYYQAKAAGYSLRFEPIDDRFTVPVELGEGRLRVVLVESGGRRTRLGKAVVRFMSTCRLGGGRFARALSKPELLRLLERNSDPDMHCRFAVDRKDGTLQVVVHQLVETLDVEELRGHLEAVARVAEETEQSWEARSGD